MTELYSQDPTNDVREIPILLDYEYRETNCWFFKIVKIFNYFAIVKLANYYYYILKDTFDTFCIEQ